MHTPIYKRSKIYNYCPLSALQFLRHGSLRDIQLDDKNDFNLTDKAMTMMGMSEAEKLGIYTVVAGVLHLGNVEFEENTEDSKGEWVGEQQNYLTKIWFTL